MDYPSNGDGNDDFFQFPSPQKKQKTAKAQAYETFKPRFDEFVGILEDSAADGELLSYFKGKFDDLLMQA